jgi:class 3 adenylate cyclase
MAHSSYVLFQVHIYPSATFRAAYDTYGPAIYTAVVAVAFIITGLLLLVYDRMVTLRQNKTMNSAFRTNRLVSTLFPEAVRDRLLEDAQVKKYEDKDFYLEDNVNGKTGYKTRPIADFFPDTTIMFADLAGFTAWSSTREPFQVFELLESIYGAMDEIANKRRVFKVETVGDCYVAATGLPTPRSDHAVVMARFATDCLYKSREIFKRLEVELGPDMAELCFRIGIHSGAITQLAWKVRVVVKTFRYLNRQQTYSSRRARCTGFRPGKT